MAAWAHWQPGMHRASALVPAGTAHGPMRFSCAHTEPTGTRRHHDIHMLSATATATGGVVV